MVLNGALFRLLHKNLVGRSSVSLVMPEAKFPKYIPIHFPPPLYMGVRYMEADLTHIFLQWNDRLV